MNKLDRIEQGYKRKTFDVLSIKRKFKATAYISYKLTDDLPEKWYKDLIVKGAVENNLPGSYIDYLVRIPSSD